MTDSATRAAAARAKILASGDEELIKRLYLLEATQGAAGASAPNAKAGQAGEAPFTQAAGPSLLGLGLATAGGVFAGSWLAGHALSGEMSRAFADVAADLGVNPADLGLDPIAGAHTPIEASDDAGGGFLDDLGLGDIFDI